MKVMVTLPPCSRASLLSVPLPLPKIILVLTMPAIIMKGAKARMIRVSCQLNTKPMASAAAIPAKLCTNVPRRDPVACQYTCTVTANNF